MTEEIFKTPEVKVILFGVGAIGSSIARLLLKKKGVKIVGAVDAAKDKVGRDLGEVIGLEKPLGVIITNDIDKLLSEVNVDLAVHSTSSFLEETCPQLTELIKHGVNVISTCEELSYPYVSNGELAKELDKLAKKHGVAVLGTGVNPGFLMDTLAITLTGLCQEVKHIRIERVMDAAKRRIPFQKKIGAGLTVEEFKRKMEQRIITGHVGLKQSIAMIAEALGWKLQEIKVEAVEPIIAQRRVGSGGIEVEQGRVAGLRQFAYGIIDGRTVITLVFQAYIGAQEEYDSITIEGTPSINEKISPCVHGDLATAAIIVNSIPKVINSTPGLKTMKDLPIPSAVLEDMRRYVKK